MTTELTTTDASGTMTPMQLIAVAIQHDADPDRLEKLMALQERYEANQAEKAFATAMHAAQQAMPAIGRDAENTHTRKRYALLESIQKKAKPIYESHGFCLSFGEADCPLDKHKRTVCDVTHTAGHTRRYHIDLPVDSSGSMNAIQGCISTTSYAQRRLLSMIFNITIAGEDDDGQGATMPISNQQIGHINRLLDRIPPEENALDRILAYGKVDSLDQFPARLFEPMIRGLEKTAREYE